MAMESSSPALAIMTIFRQLEGKTCQKLAFVATVRAPLYRLPDWPLHK